MVCRGLLFGLGAGLLWRLRPQRVARTFELSTAPETGASSWLNALTECPIASREAPSLAEREVSFAS
jgi:hypothetical protein